jgi:hypothetical protein
MVRLSIANSPTTASSIHPSIHGTHHVSTHHPFRCKKEVGAQENVKEPPNTNKRKKQDKGKKKSGGGKQMTNEPMHVKT